MGTHVPVLKTTASARAFQQGVTHAHRMSARKSIPNEGKSIPNEGGSAEELVEEEEREPLHHHRRPRTPMPRAHRVVVGDTRCFC